MRRSTRALISGLLAGLPTGFAVAIPLARAQEPLFLRIRPAGETATDSGGAARSDDEVARQARARAQAVWDRADRRARVAIASVCTGCLMPERATPALSPRSEAVDAVVLVPVPSSSIAQTGAP